MKYSKGFTLIELMVSLVIGLIVIGAGLQLFLTGSINYNLQKSLAELQDNGNFGLNYLIKDIKLANLDADLSIINDRNKYSGIVLTSFKSYASLTEEDKEIQSANLPLYLQNSSVDIAKLTRSKVGPSNVNVASDQLVIQYKAFDPNGFDCEGNAITQDEIDQGLFIVQRYFLRADGDTKDLALACDAGRYKSLVATDDLPTGIQNFGDNGQIIMRRVDYFHVLLGVKQNDSDEFSYMTIDEYIGADNSLEKDGNPRARIMSVQIGALVRGYDTISGNDALPNSFRVLNSDVTLNSSLTEKYVRDVVSQTVALRNGYGLMEEL
ncbi:MULTISPECIES: PilW family protein [unclassified Acinetobacter]|uniref:PilW family protein n=1 Tax=Acinetobacter TaxID=469 RepID=UPI00053725B8|nr:PilW family protein [Acinetobacter sp. HR7]KGT46651.1 prepilin-type cleavage/methylation N-terminal domain protein [Acinetobacter sp. HR7]